MASSSKQLTCADYHVAWICPVADVELLPARLMLDEEIPTPQYDTHYDENTYICGSINGHTVVIATLPQGATSNVNAGRLTGSMFKTFPNIRMAVLVGIGGGIPRSSISDDPLENIHLGDVVVGWPGDGKPACVYHDRGRSKVDGNFEIVGTMQDPDWRITNALSILASNHDLGRTKFDAQLSRLQGKKKFTHPGLESDRLFRAAYHHTGDYGSRCMSCDRDKLVQRPPRTEDDKKKLVFHQGRIATGNAVVQDGELRDQISARCDGALCVETEAAGVDINRRCLVIRGISDYADSHKDDVWKSYAAGNAAAFTRELLCMIQPAVVKDMEGATEAPWLVPFTRPRCFIGREAQLAQILAHISLEDCQRLAIYGLGGCGKTALALESAYRISQQRPTRAIFWVPAINRESFEQAYQEIGVILHIPGITDEKANVKQLVKARLSDEEFGQWLIIVDNADDDSVLFNPVGEGNRTDRLIDFLPHSRKGSVLYTTRTRKAAIKLAESNVIGLGELNKSEAMQVLKTRLLPEHQHQLESAEMVDEFFSMLAFLVLAIVQAAYFINQNGLTLVDYMSYYEKSEQHATNLLSEEFEDHGRYRTTKNPVATTWYISFEQIRRQDEVAADLFSFMACTANNDIPESMLPINGSELERAKAIGTLKAYAFITERQHESHSFDVHPLVHLAIRGWLKAHNQWNIWAERTLARLVGMVPNGEYDMRQILTSYLPHAEYVVALPAVYDARDRMILLDRIGDWELTLGRYIAAEMACRQRLEQSEKLLGKEHPDTLRSSHNLVCTLAQQGKYTEAEAKSRKTLALQQKVLGEEHEHTLLSMNLLVCVLSAQGKYVDAKMILQKTLALRREVLGKEHPDTLKSMENVALSLRKLGMPAEAEKMHQESLTLQKRILGEEHPDTLTNMGSLANTLLDQGRYVEAEKLYQETLVLRKRVLGEEHPNTLTSMCSLAKTLSHQGRYVEAEELYQETLVLRKSVLGEEHPHTLSSMCSLANTLSHQGRYVEAEKLYQDTLAMHKRAAGGELLGTLECVHAIANMLICQRRYSEAEKMFHEALALRVKVLGEKHPDTLFTVRRLAYVLRQQKQYNEALPLYERAYAGLLDVNGASHPDAQRCLQ